MKNFVFRAGGFILYKFPKFSPRFARGGFILYKFPKFSPALRAGGFIFYKICCQNWSIFGHFLNRFPLNNSQKPLKIFARFARRVLGVPKNFPRFAREVLFFTKSQKNSRASRGRFYSLQNPQKFSPALRAGGFILYKILKNFHRHVLRRGGGFNSISLVLFLLKC